MTVAVVLMRPAQPKEIPVVTANWPTKLNQPVNQEKNGAYLGGASIAAQKYGPPAVGIAETISAIAMATNIVKNETHIHPTVITPGPPVLRP